MHSQVTVKPILPATARKAGATRIDRCGPHTFMISFSIVGDDLNAPGNGPAVLAAVAAWAASRDFGISWECQQKFGIYITARKSA